MRCPGTTPMGFLVHAAMMGDSSSVTAAGQRLLKKEPGSGDGNISRRTTWLFKWEPPSGAVSGVQTMGEVQSSQIHSSRVRVIL
ncbi:hypothetical protein Zmor_011039 [Zophobas morio]|uniref:Uncharacterized protein n=1 Tax=Zophobas morio TaxID=2755281 RepID=A0AA38MKI3_9CUCU|nr:hypothetical protein Zmor_011039 [Zophobas morio]